MSKGTSKVERQLTRTSSLISAILVIISAITGLCAWLSTQFQNAVAGQIDEVKQSIEESNKSQDLAIMRLELMSLIENDPENVVEIERLGKKYFQAGGDTWMSGYYSRYAHKHGLDTSFIVK